MKSLKHKGFSIIEVLLGITIFSMVMTGAFYALSAVNIGKIKLIEETNIEKDSFYFSEVLFDFVKQGGVIDFEEYFNRQTINTGAPSLYQDGHYVVESDFGNGSTTMYYCVSKNGSQMFPRIGTDTGCLDDYNINSLSLTAPSYNTDVYSLGNKELLYNQYLYQFIDYNSDADGDSGDENANNLISRDDDDEFVGDGPEVYGTDGRTYEIYLINGDGDKRTFLRWNVSADPDAPSFATCTGLGGLPTDITGDGCLGRLEYLKLAGVDWGYDHDVLTEDATQFDGKVDTWIYDSAIYGLSTNVLALSTNDDDYWVPLFPDTMNVKSFEIYLYPHKDIKYAWRDFSASANINPYLRVKLTLSPARARRKGIRGVVPEYKFNTTISLTDIYSR